MSDDLSAMFQATAREEAAAAEREFPLTPAALGRFVGHVRRRRAARATALAVGSGFAVAGVILGLGFLWHLAPFGPAATPSPTSSLSPSPTASPSATPSASPSATQSPSANPSPTLAVPSPSPTAPPPPEVKVPAAVSGLSAGPGGGSGEISVRWTGTPGATGYRVYRSSTPGGPMTRAASFSLATGHTTVEFGGSYESIQIWSPSPNTFEYVEAVDGQPGYFVVVAFNSAGEGPRQGTVCAVPMAQPGSC